ncbi:hypothetical protein NDU88_008074 [Pleurodeles waltl]|uniref:Uncharacterized protein n=1 Tax=Pleurodeles waltl TaxID=8319 RepID=A0AAV7QQT9_PLEWA|nr:hypothetical protein NDU88_008074 [Pleurodeles waltl]
MPGATGAADSKWRLNLRRPAGPGAGGSPVDAAAPEERAAGSAGSTWARFRDLDHPRTEERCGRRRGSPGDPGPAIQAPIVDRAAFVEAELKTSETHPGEALPGDSRLARVRVEAERSRAVHACCSDPGIECRHGGAAVAASIRTVPWSPGARKAQGRGVGALQKQPVAPPTGPLRKRPDRVWLVEGGE